MKQQQIILFLLIARYCQTLLIYSYVDVWNIQQCS